MALQFVITNAGRAALLDGSGGTRAVRIASVGVSPTAVAADPAATALAGEVKRIATIAGDAVAADVLHLIVRDESDATYTVRSFALFLADGTLFGIYGQPAVILEKSAGAVFLLAVDLTLVNVPAAAITFGATDFLNPPATSEQAGVVELATDAEAAALLDAVRALTPKTAAAFFTAANVLARLLTVDGAGSGLDADMVDGRNVGTSGDAIPSLAGANSWSARQVFRNVAVGAAAYPSAIDIHGTDADQLRLRTAESEYYRLGRNAGTGWLDFWGSQSGYTGYRFGGVDGDKMVVAPSGYVGIGTSAPSAKLHVDGDAKVDGSVAVPAHARVGYLPADSYADYGTRIANYGVTFGIGIDGNAGTAVAGYGGVVISTGQTERVRVAANGNVGIGTNAPRDKLDVNGSVMLTWANRFIGAQFDATDTYRLGLRTYPDQRILDLCARGAGDGGSGVITFSPGIGSEAARFNASGNFGLGTAAPSYKLHVAGSACFDSLYRSGYTVWDAANDGAGSGLDADLLDGQQGAWYADVPARLGYTPVNRAGDNFTGPIAVRHEGLAAGIRISNRENGYGFIQYGDATDANIAFNWYMGAPADGTFELWQGRFGFGQIRLRVTSTTLAFNNSLIWTAANDGAGSGLDADLLDGQHGAWYADVPARLGYAPVNRAGDNFTGPVGIRHDGLAAGLRISNGTNGYGFVQFGEGSDANTGFNWYMGSPADGTFGLHQGPFGSGIRRLQITSATIAFNDALIWTGGNDGAGSGLDADLLDGRHAADFMLRAGGSFAGEISRDGAGRYPHWNEQLAGSSISRSDGAPPAGADGDIHFEVNVGLGTLRLWHNVNGTWVHS